MYHHLINGLLAGLLTATVSVWAQSSHLRSTFAQIPTTPTPSTTSAPPAPTSAPTSSPERVRGAEGAQAATVEGCVASEQDVPGRITSPIERAGVADDYLLIDAKIVAGSAPAAPQLHMFEIEGLAKETVKSHLGRRVRLEGSFDGVDSGLLQIQATVIKRIEGTCPPRPTTSK